MSEENIIVDAEVENETTTPNAFMRLRANVKKNASVYTAVAIAAGGVLVGAVGFIAASKLEKAWEDEVEVETITVTEVTPED